MQMRAAEVGPPTPDDFEVLKEAVLELADEPDAIVRAPGEQRLFVKLERLFSDFDFIAWPPLTICFSGLLTRFNCGTKMVLRYRELAHNAGTENSSVNHDYILELCEGQIVEFGQSIRACPEVREPRIESPEIYRSDLLLDQAEAGRKLLRQNTGTQLELTAGDCGVLFDRLAMLMC